MTPRVAVIGGGYAGMAAAVALAESGLDPVVFESAKALGGRARRIDYRQETLDNGQHILSGAYRELLELMRKVGVPAAALTRIPLTLSMPPQFSLRAPHWIAPLNLAWALLSAQGLSLAERFAAIRFMQALKRDAFKVDAGQTVTELLLQHRQPPRLVRYLWQPLTVSALNTPIETASAAVFANVLRDALGGRRDASDLLLPATDLSRLFPDAAQIWLRQRGHDVRTGTRVTRIDAGQEGWRVTADGNELPFAALILAIGPHQWDAMALPDGLAAPQFQYEPIITAYFKWDTPVRLSQPMLGQTEGLAQWLFDRRQMPAAQKTADGLIAVVISASGPHLELDQDALTAALLGEIAAQVRVPATSLPPPVWSKIVTEKFATFACTPSAQPLRPSTRTALPGLFLAGDYVAGDYPATLEGAARAGLAAAAATADYLQGARQ